MVYFVLQHECWIVRWKSKELNKLKYAQNTKKLWQQCYWSSETTCGCSDSTVRSGLCCASSEYVERSDISQAKYSVIVMSTADSAGKVLSLKHSSSIHVYTYHTYYVSYSSELQRVADIESRRRLRSASSPSLHVPRNPRSLHKTIGDRACPVAAAKVWNMLPPAITSLSSLEAFKRALKTELFRRSYGNAHHRQQYHWHLWNTWHTAALKFL